MRRFIVALASALCIATAAFAQAEVPASTALTTAMADINARLGTNYVYNGGLIGYQFNTERVAGDNLGCANVAATNQNAYLQTTARFDIDVNGTYEWEYRFAYEADGALRTVICAMPANQTPDAAATPDALATVQPDSTLAPIFGRDGARILPPTVCGSLKSRLINGSTGRVIRTGAQNNLRQSPDLTALKIGALQPGESFVVMDGPFCVGDISWYLVGDGTTPKGWTAEGVDRDYYIEPTLTDAERIASDNAARLTAFGSPLAPGAQTISANGPDGVLIGTSEGWQVFGVQTPFAALAAAVFSPKSEVQAASSWLFADNTGRQWALQTDGSSRFIVSSDAGFTAVAVPATGTLPVAAIDNESNFAAVVANDASAVELVQIGRSGEANTPIATLNVSGAVQDVAFSADSMHLYVLTSDEITVFDYVMGEGWSPQARQVVGVDVAQGKLALDESGSRVAVTGVTASGVGAIRVFNNLNTETVGDETRVNYDSPQGETFSRPAFSPDGGLVVAHSSASTLALLDTATGAVSYLPLAGATAGQTGAVAFSRDGLTLWVLNGASGVQVYGVALTAAN